MHFLWAIYFYLLSPLLTLLVWVIIINVVLSWLVSFRVVNPHNQLVSMIGRFTSAVTYPLQRPLQRVIPTLGGIDLSPIILILAIYFVRGWLLPELIGMVAGPPSLGRF